MLYFGSAIFKIARLLFIAMLCVHFFACIYYRVKRETTPNPDDVEAFYQSKYVEQDVSCRANPSSFAMRCAGALTRALSALAAGSSPCLRQCCRPSAPPPFYSAVCPLSFCPARLLFPWDAPVCLLLSSPFALHAMVRPCAAD